MNRSVRILTAASGTIYLFWWALVELLLPGSFNPLASRLAVVAFCWALFVASCLSSWVDRRLSRLFPACVWAITAHYFYLFYFNPADINWVVGAFITVVACSACLQTEGSLLAYSGLVLALSVALAVGDPLLARSTFFSGVITVLALVYVGTRARLRALRQSQETSLWFENLFDAVFEGVVVHDHGRVIGANEAFARIFGYGVHEIQGMNVEDFVAPECRQFTDGQIAAAAETPYEVQGLRRDGTQVPIEVRGRSHALGGKIVRLAAVFDLTERKKAEQARVLYEASQRAIRMRDEFLSIASHELKTPLTNVKLQTQMAMRELKRQEKPLSPERVRKFIEQTDRQADRLTHLVEEMLDVSRISSGKMRMEPEELDLAELVREVAAAFESLLLQEGYRLDVEADGPAWVRADRFRMEQVVSNLLSNAIKYGERKPIRIRVKPDSRQASLTVEDGGGGIPLDKQEKIFERFERAVSSRKISGLGLGLYITRHIVDAHGGRIEVASDPGRGSRFTVVLPKDRRGYEGTGLGGRGRSGHPGESP